MTHEASRQRFATLCEWISVNASWFIPSVLGALALVDAAYFGTLLLGHSYSCDYEVYRVAGESLRKGLPIYDTITQGCDLKFTYTPFAAGIFAVMSVFGSAGFWVWTMLSLVALGRLVWLVVESTQFSLAPLTRRQSVVGVSLLLLPLEPFVKTLWYGQINIVIVWLIAESFLGPFSRASGIYSAIATGIKLTPGLFSVFLVGVRGLRTAIIGATTLAVTIAVGFLLQPDQAKLYWTNLIVSTDRVGPQEYLYNQSLNGFLWRLNGPTYDSPIFGLTFSLLVVLGGLWLARAFWLRNKQMWALAVIALVTLFVSPISWTHHYVSFTFVFVALLSDSAKHVPSRVVLVITYVWLLLANLTFRAMPKGNHREFAYTGWHYVAANQYVYLTIGLLFFAAVRLRTLTRFDGELVHRSTLEQS